MTSLENFPNLPALEELFLSRNKIHGAELKHLAHLVNLKLLVLSDNQIANVDDLKPLAGIELQELELEDNDVTARADYRKQIFGMFKSLHSVDREDAEGNQIEEEEDISNFPSCTT